MVVFFLISLVITPPIVSIPSDKGVTSNNKISVTPPPSTPPCKAAPIATASSGLTSLRGSLPKNSCTVSCTLGIRVCPPTRITSSISEADKSASFKATRQGSMVLVTNSSTRDSNFARVNLIFKCLGPVASAVIYGRFTSVC